MIPFNAFSKAHTEIETELTSAIQEVVTSNWFIGGKHLDTFEAQFAEYCGSKFAIGCGNGLDALIIALKALGVGEGDEVIVPAHTFIATALAVLQVGAIPVLCDVNPQTYLLDVACAEVVRTSKTKAIIPVHLYGLMVNMPELMAWAETNSILVIEDNAQSQGATVNGQRSGSFGHINATSFYPGKNLGAFGDAGAITTNNLELANYARTYGNYGSIVKYQHDIAGVNSRLDTIQAAILTVKLKYLDKWNAERNQLATLYKSLLQNVGDIKFQFVPENQTHVYHLMIIQTAKRDALQSFLLENEVQTLIHYPIPVHKQKACLDQVKYQDLSVSEHLAQTVLSLPMYPGLSNSSVETICSVIKRFYA